MGQCIDMLTLEHPPVAFTITPHIQFEILLGEIRIFHKDLDTVEGLHLILPCVHKHGVLVVRALFAAALGAWPFSLQGEHVCTDLHHAMSAVFMAHTCMQLPSFS